MVGNDNAFGADLVDRDCRIVWVENALDIERALPAVPDESDVVPVQLAHHQLGQDLTRGHRIRDTFAQAARCRLFFLHDFLRHVEIVAGGDPLVFQRLVDPLPVRQHVQRPARGHRPGQDEIPPPLAFAVAESHDVDSDEQRRKSRRAGPFEQFCQPFASADRIELEEVVFLRRLADFTRL